MKDLKDKVAAITGAGSGIGRALAVNLAKQGCHLALSDVDAVGLDETRILAESEGVKVHTAKLDVSDRKAVFDWADEVVEHFGYVSMIYNNAGVALSGTVEGLSIEDYEWIMDINFWGVVYGTKAFLKHMEKQGEGHIINISSVFGLTSQPLMSGYNASKFAVRGFTESLRQDLELTGSKVSTTCVHPGGIKTNIAKAARMDESMDKMTSSSKEESVSQFEKAFINTPQKAANKIVKGVKKNKRRVLIGPDAKVYDLMVRLFPTGYQKVFTKVVAKTL
jgi:short-subunit dehydrogenase